MKSKIILALIVVFISGTVCNAAPADPTPREVKQADGTVITIRSYGDEFFMWSENMGGYVIAYDCENKNWCYALIDGDSLVPSSLIVGNGDIAQPWMLKYNDIKPLINRVVGSVKIYPENTTLIISETVQLNSWINGHYPSTKMTWSTSNAEVATVNDGLVTAIAPGEATITVTSDHRETYNTAQCVVTVKEPEPYISLETYAQKCTVTLHIAPLGDGYAYIYALYNNDNLIDVDVKSAPEKVEYDVRDVEGLSVKVLIWESLESMKPVCAPLESKFAPIKYTLLNTESKPEPQTVILNADKDVEILDYVKMSWFSTKSSEYYRGEKSLEDIDNLTVERDNSQTDI